MTNVGGHRGPAKTVDLFSVRSLTEDAVVGLLLSGRGSSGIPVSFRVVSCNDNKYMLLAEL